MTETSSVPHKLHRLTGVATALSVVACYGTLLVIGALSLLGVSLAVNTGVWAGTIVFFAAVAVVGVALGYLRHRVPGPLMLAVAGTLLIAWVMFGSFNRALELTGFAALVIATAWDWRLKKSTASAR